MYEGITYYFIDNEQYFKRDTVYGSYDDGEIFAFFSRAVLEVLPVIDFFPDIINANEFKFPHYDKITTKVIAICKGKESAVNIVKNLVLDVYKNTGSYDVKKYFSDKEFGR